MNRKENKKPKNQKLYWIENWKREIEGAYLYGKLAELTPDGDLHTALAVMADQERDHAALWAQHIREVEPQVRNPSPDLRIRMVLWIARLLGSEAVLGFLMSDEVSDIASYSQQAQTLGDEGSYRTVLTDETTHARALDALRKKKLASRAEPWHRNANASGWLRDVVYGFNDGLTANFGLVMGMVGASVDSKVVLLTGFAGLLADALSMASSGFLAAKSEQEVQQHHLALEQAELTLMPHEEREELVRQYVNKGLTREEAESVADRLMKNPEVALSQLARDELGLEADSDVSPLREGVTTGIATTLGAFIPILPFMFLPKTSAVWTGIAISMAAHFLVGASRAIFTGRPALRSGLEMFAVGMGIALLTFVLGLLIGVR